tara:strand:- start:170 stop:526 length:357 start_codon:yes stop_codon:yes gene_type:complete
MFPPYGPGLSAVEASAPITVDLGPFLCEGVVVVGETCYLKSSSDLLQGPSASLAGEAVYTYPKPPPPPAIPIAHACGPYTYHVDTTIHPPGAYPYFATGIFYAGDGGCKFDATQTLKS